MECPCDQLKTNMETFQKEIVLFSKVFDDEEKKWNQVEVKKTATFKELDRLDKSQHKLQFKLVTLFKMNVEEDDPEISSDALYDITVKFINQMLIIDKDFNSGDKTEFLQDSGAIFNFGTWLLKDKFTDFFLILTGTK
jgi:hypothetical protein